MITVILNRYFLILYYVLYNMNKKTKRRTSHSRNSKTIKNKIYTESEYSSGDGFLTSVWGPAIWHFLHTISFNYPVEPTTENKKHYRDFILNLKYILPCKHCRDNLDKNFKTNPLTMAEMKNRYTFSLYIYKLHEVINKMLNKKSGLSYEDVRERYEHFRARGCDVINKKIKEKGCSTPLYGKKSKCLLKIVPQDDKSATFQMDQKCIKTR